MANKQVSESVFSLPSCASKARQVSTAVMLAGFLFVPMVFFVYHRFVATRVSLDMQEFFTIFTACYLLLFIICTGKASNASQALRNRLGNDLPRDVAIAAPAAANSGVPEIVGLGRKYWFWQLVSGYFAGLTFSWLGCLFVLFVI